MTRLVDGDFCEVPKLKSRLFTFPIHTFYHAPSFRLASKKVLVVLYGVLSMVFASAGAYFSGTITTIEKRFKIPSKNMGIISVGNDISSLVLSGFIAYYGGKSHRPRWIGVGLSLIVLNCLLNASPHFFYGAGDDALALTTEFGGVSNDHQSEEAQEAENRKLLCRTNGNSCGLCARA